ncbi:hypothetical protein [Pectobacterium aquaticum]|uniref:hypothetical protein n=1 Tax=Pectobacterium aquaticum TaxID=2204145 RepID=UPI0016707255|nr:hypothetical protein [Pectobacterium aquaticum]MCH5051148.1 hypothetical protein [Pectobacterium aquaticum]
MKKRRFAAMGSDGTVDSGAADREEDRLSEHFPCALTTATVLRDGARLFLFCA